MANINGIELEEGENLLDIPELKDVPITSQTGLAAIALNFAMKYADIVTVQDGQLYQQYKLEGKNMHGLHLDEVFYWAGEIEKHLLRSPSRLALAVFEAVSEDLDAVLAEEDAASADGSPEGGDGEAGSIAEGDDSAVGEAETPNG